MSRNRSTCQNLLAIVTLMALASPLWAVTVERRQVVVSRQVQEGVVVLTRGPVHEAFAEPLTFDHSPGLVVKAAPPELLEEVPPTIRPSDPAAVWIPGYWAWDDETESYLWVSGIWRVPPAGRIWVSGYWAETDEGHVWAPGFWISEDVAELTYYPTPPDPLQVKLVTNAPTADSIWVPGVWHYVTDRWLWEPGQWVRPIENWIWVPTHWVWSPSGHIFIEGYWDYVPERRGIIFAPLQFTRPVYREVKYVHRPEVVIQVSSVTEHLFVRPQTRHYYFGDYYDAQYERRGYEPWFRVVERREWYDPILVHRQWTHRENWQRMVSEERRYYEVRRERVEARPPRTFTDQLELVRTFDARRVSDRDRAEVIIAQPVTQIIENQRVVNQRIENRTSVTNVQNITNVQNNITNLRVVEMEPEYRERFLAQERELRRLRSERQEWERESRRAFAEQPQQARRERTLDIKPILNAIQEIAPKRSVEERVTEIQRSVASEAAAEGAAPAVQAQQLEAPPKPPEILQVAPAPANVPTATPSQEGEATTEATPTPAAVETATPTPTPGDTADEDRAARRLRATRERDATPTPDAAITPAASPTPDVTITPTATPHATATPDMTATPATVSPTPDITPTASPTPIVSPTPSTSPDASPTPVPAETPAVTPSATVGEDGPGRVRGRGQGRGANRGEDAMVPTPAAATPIAGTTADVTPSPTPLEGAVATPAMTPPAASTIPTPLGRVATPDSGAKSAATPAVRLRDMRDRSGKNEGAGSTLREQGERLTTGTLERVRERVQRKRAPSPITPGIDRSKGLGKNR